MIYLDNSATTLKKPDSVVAAVTAALTQLGNSGRGVHEDALKSSQIIYEARQKLTNLFNGTDPRQLVFTSGATESLNTVIYGLHQKGDHIITTALEHNSVLRPLYRMEKAGVELSIVPADAQGNISYQALSQRIQKNTKSIIITHCSNVTGNIIDLACVSQICQEHQLLLIVDAAQSAGLLPVDVTAQKIDALCFTGHKSLYGPQGTGGIYLAPELKVTPLKVGGSGIDTYNQQQPEIMPTALEAGTLNGHGIAGLTAGVDYLMTETLEKIYSKTQQRTQQFYQEVKAIPQIKIYGDFSQQEHGPIVSLNIDSLDSAEVSDLLAYEYQIATRSGGHCAPLMHQALGTKEQGVVRFSFSSFTTEAEIQQAITALKMIAGRI